MVQRSSLGQDLGRERMQFSLELAVARIRGIVREGSRDLTGKRRPNCADHRKDNTGALYQTMPLGTRAREDVRVGFEDPSPGACFRSAGLTPTAPSGVVLRSRRGAVARQLGESLVDTLEPNELAFQVRRLGRVNSSSTLRQPPNGFSLAPTSTRNRHALANGSYIHSSGTLR